MPVMRLATLYPSLSTEEREALAKKVDISSGYLYQLATRWRGKKPTVSLMVRLADSDQRLTLADLAEEFSQEPAAEARA